jgi:hypothetical protein
LSRGELTSGLHSALEELKPLHKLFASELGRVADLRVLERAYWSDDFFRDTAGAGRLREFIEAVTRVRSRIPGAPPREAHHRPTSVLLATRRLRRQMLEELAILPGQLAARARIPTFPVTKAEPILAADLNRARSRIAERLISANCPFECVNTDIERIMERLAEIPESAGAILALSRFIETKGDWTQALLRKIDAEWCSRVAALMEQKLREKKEELAELEKPRCMEMKQWAIGACGHSFCEKCMKDCIAHGKCRVCKRMFNDTDVIAIHWE